MAPADSAPERSPGDRYGRLQSSLDRRLETPRAAGVAFAVSVVILKADRPARGQGVLQADR